MANDPAFLFYPGDYLRDTQCLSENVQVAYDRIMCEHMRNICITQQQLNFFTKKLSTDEKEELLMVLTKISGGFQITWVAESIVKRKAYSQSRRENRTKKEVEDINNISVTYVQHMENENEIIIEKENINKEIPEFSEFLAYAKEKEPSIKESSLKNKYDAWIENGWKNGNDRKIKNWKSSLLQTMPYLEKNGKSTTNDEPTIGRMPLSTAIANSTGWGKSKPD